MRRISVVGSSGSGKTTLARELAERLGIEHVELDSLFHGPGWEPRPREVFRSAVQERCDAEGWVACGNYGSHAQDLVWARADTVVVLDLPRPLVTARLTRRTLRRVTTREELWNGNRERWRDALAFWDEHRSVIRWSWSHHQMNRERYRTAAADPSHSHLRFVVLTSPREVRSFLDGVPAVDAQSPPS